MKLCFSAIAAVGILLSVLAAQGEARQSLSGHVPQMTANRSPLGRLPSSQRLNLAIGLPLRNQGALTNLLRQIYDPKSPNYRHYLTPEEFAARFGPGEADYAALAAFAETNGLRVTTRHPNRMLLDVEGSAADIERTLHLHLNNYAHPSEARTFYAPDAEPTLDLAVPVLHISGLDNTALPCPRLLATRLDPAQAAASPQLGSGPGGTYRGADFRAAYAPGVILNGTGQKVGLLQFDGYTASDIAYYEAQAGLPSVTLSNVLLDGFGGGPSGFGGGEVEVSLDIEMAISMAPGLSAVIVYMAGPYGDWHDILNRMATDNAAKQLSCSWYIPGGGIDAVADQIFQQMAAQGQSFFNASGDFDAYTGPIDFPGETPYLTQVGGTTLTTSGGGGAWVSETVWNRNNGIGSGAGISTRYAIPSWQAPVDMTANLGSTTQRNTPDVALTAENVYVRADGVDWSVGGTSCAAPLWAGFCSLINQQAAAYGRPSPGFVNPAVYALGLGGGYGAAFHDITTGNNFSSSSPSRFPAVAGFDLCTGWGTPNGQGLINALAIPDNLVVSPSTGFSASGATGGPFSPTMLTCTLTNIGTNSLTWSLANTSIWLTASSAGGVLAGGSAVSVTVSLNLAAGNLPPAQYTADLLITNVSSGFLYAVPFALLVHDALVITPTNGFSAIGPVGGPFTTTSVNYALSNSSSADLNWSLANPSAWLNASSSGGLLPAGLAATVNVGLNSNASNLPPALYTGDIQFTNLTSGFVQDLTFALQTGELPVQNNGFESGNFLGWTLSGNTQGSTVSSNLLYAHSGNYGAREGLSSSLGYLSQTLNTVPGHLYLISAWLEDPGSVVPNEFQLNWDGVNVLDLVNVTNATWTNIQVVVAALGTNSVLHFGFQNGGSYFGFDDVTVFETTGATNPPVITTQPANETVTAGLTAAFAAGVTGIPPFLYQWQFNGANIANATNAMLVLSPAATNEAGLYSVVVSNAFGGTVSSNAQLTVVVPSCVTPSSGLVSWWRAESNASDSIGTNDGLWQGGSSFVDGEVGQAFSFNGTNQFVDVADSPGLNPAGSLTLEAWIYPRLPLDPVSSPIIKKAGEGSAQQDGYALEFAGTSGVRLVAYISGGIGYVASPTMPVVMNQWNHVAGVYDGTNLSTYVNGVVGGSTPASGQVVSSANHLQIGHDPSNAGRYYNGFIDEASVYSAALSSAQLVSIYNAAAAGKCQSVAAPVIVTQPQSQSVFVGTSVGFVVGATGSRPLGYQWSFDGTNIAAATDAVLNLVNVQLADSGSYAVVVSNAYGATNSSNALLSVTIPVCDPAPLGIVSWWAGNGNSLDSFGANDGVLQGGPGFSSGEVGQAFDFNGSSQFVDVASSAGLNPVGQLTLEAWIYPRQFGSIASPIIKKAGEGSVQQDGYALEMVGTSGMTFGVFVGGGYGWTETPYAAVPLNQWSHVAGVYDGTNLQFYLNGTPAGAPVAVHSPIVPSGNNLQIGHDPSNPGRYYNGLIDEATVYNMALTAGQVQAIYLSGSSGKCQPTNPPVILSQPAGLSALVGGTASFSVLVSGVRPLTYQWTLNGTNLAGATGASLNFTNLSTNQAGSYAALVSNSFGSVLSSNASLTVTPPPACDPIPAGLVSWWQAEGSSGDSFGTNDGSFQGGTGFGVGEVGQAFNFNGASQYVDVPNSPGLNPTTNLTLEAWIYPRLPLDPLASPIIKKAGEGSGQQHGYMLEFAGTNGVRLILDLGGGASYASPVAPVGFNQWSHVAGVYDGTNLMIYVNGNLAGATSDSGLIVSSGNDLQIGHDPANAGRFYNGLIDEASLYNTALTAGQIQAIYLTGSGGKCQPTNLPVILNQPGNQNVLVGGTALFSVRASGVQPLSYLWSLNGTNLGGATGASLALNNVNTNQAGNYAVLAGNSNGSVLSSNALLTVTPPPPCGPIASGLVSWWAAEQGALDNIGTNNGSLQGGAGFAGGEVGQAFNFNGTSQYVDVPSSTSLNPTAKITLEAWIYPRLPQDPVAAPIIKKAGEGSGQQDGYTLEFSGTSGVRFILNLGNGNSGYASPIAPVAFNQWSHVAGVYDGANVQIYVNGSLAGSTSGSGVIVPSGNDLQIGHDPSNAGRYYNGLVDEASIYNTALTAGQIQSIYLIGSGGKCQPTTPPVIVSQPANQTIFVGSNANFNVTAAGPALLSYQWICNGTNLAGATTSTLVLTNVQLAQAANYAVRLSSLYASTTSSNAVLAVNPIPPCTPAPGGLVGWWQAEGNGSDSAGTNNGTLQGGAGFAGGIVGQAFNFNGSGYLDVPNSPNLNPTTTLSLEAWIYPRQYDSVAAPIIKKAGEGSGQSDGYTMEIVGSSGITLGVYASGGSGWHATAYVPVPLNQWSHVAGVYNGTNLSFYLNGVRAGAPVAVPAPIVPSGNHLQVGHDPSNSGRYFNGLIDEASVYAAALSSTQILAIYNAGPGGKCPFPLMPAITTQPQSQGVVLGCNANFSVTATGTWPLSYQWRFNGTNLGGASASGLSLTNVQPANAGNYSVFVTNVAGSTVSSNALLTILYPPVITKEPARQLVMPGCTASFTATATGTAPLGYQWLRNGAALPSQTGTNLTFVSVSSFDFATYSLTATNGYGQATSSNALLALDNPPNPGGTVVQRFATGGIRVGVAGVLANVSDADGDSLKILAVDSNSVAGGTVNLSGSSIYYAPPAGSTNADAFNYTVSDGHCGGTAVGTVLVQVRTDSNPAARGSIEPSGNNSVRLFFDGLPGYAYRIQSTDSLDNPNWQDLVTLTADQFGTVVFVDAMPTNAPVRYYRAVWPP